MSDIKALDCSPQKGSKTEIVGAVVDTVGLDISRLSVVDLTYLQTLKTKAAVQLFLAFIELRDKK